MKSITNLTQKQQQDFKSIVKMLDNKDYKKGLKQINKLSSQVESGEILSLKSIFLFYNDQKQEGTALAKQVKKLYIAQALFKNLKSDFCWHIYGLINKAQKNYSEAIKCFQQTLKNDLGNEALQRDLANLQLHVRDYEGHAETRRTLLFNKTSQIINWVSFAVGNHLNSELESAQQAIESTANLISNDTKHQMKSLEQNEFALYQATLLLELKRYEDVIKFMEVNRSKITDRLSYNELLFQTSLQSGDKENAKLYAKQLIELQPQNWNYYKNFFQVAGVDGSQPLLLATTIKENFQTKENSLLKGRLLGYISIDQFEESFIEFITPYFSKALPSLFREIIHVYKDPTKIAIMEKCYVSFLNDEDLSRQLWALMLLAQHFNYVKDYDVAIQWIEKAIEHTPTLHELYLVKAKILKGQKQFIKAAEVTDMVRKLDLADRYMNNKAIRYALRANLIYAAQDLIRLFLRDANESNPHDIQTIWYELAMGEAYLRLNYYGPAFRMFKFIEKHFEEMYEDQVEQFLYFISQTEFYQYSIRKYSIRTLFDMIKSSDEVHNNKQFIKSAGQTIQGLMMFSQLKKVFYSKLQKKQDTEDNQKVKLTPQEKKRLQKLKQKEEEDQQLRLQFSIEGHIYTPELRQKLDLLGEQLLVNYHNKIYVKATLQDNTSIINEINQIAKILINTSNTKDIKSCFNAFKHLVDFYIQQDRPTLAMKLFYKLVRYTDNNNKVVSHKYKLKLLVYLQNVIKTKQLDPLIMDAIEKGLQEILNGLTIQQYNDKFFNDHQNKSVSLQITALECSHILAGTTNDQQKTIIVNLIKASSVSIQELYSIIEDGLYLLDDLKIFVEEKYPILFEHYFVDPNLKWQERQIQDKKQLALGAAKQ